MPQDQDLNQGQGQGIDQRNDPKPGGSFEHPLYNNLMSSGPQGTQVQPSVIQTNNIQKLNGTNFLAWKRQIEMVLELRGLSDTIICDRVDRRLDLQASLLLLETMDIEHQNFVQAESTARGMMDVLNREYADKTEANKHKMLSEYFRYQKRPEDSIIKHVTTLKTMRAALSNVNEVHSDALFQVNLLHTMPPEFDEVKKAWQITHPSMKSNEFLISMLKKREEEIRSAIEQPSQELMLLKRSIQEMKKSSHCGKCKQLGHWHKDLVCPLHPLNPKNKNKFRGKAMPDLQNSDQTNMMISGDQELDPFAINETSDARNFETNDEGNPEDITINLAVFELDNGESQSEMLLNSHHYNGLRSLKNEWIADSGATCHMSPVKEYFTELKLLDKPKRCSVGNGSTAEITGIGKMVLNGIIDGKRTKINLSDVNFIPSLTTNILSIGVADEHGLNTTFAKGKCIISNINGPVLTGTRAIGRLYKLNVLVARPYESLMMIINNRTATEWHKALGHINPLVLKQVLSERGIKLEQPTTNNEVRCNTCPYGTAIQSSHPSTNRKSMSIGELCHVDLSGKLNKPSIEGHSYYILFKDDYSGYVHCNFMKTKDETPALIQKYVIDFENESGFRVRTIRSDNGSEFVNAKVTQLMLRERISWDHSTPFCPQQNGKIERTMRTITGSARTMLCTSELPTFLWNEAIRNAVYIRNRIPTTGQSKSPFEIYMGRKPHIEHILPFGEQVLTLIKDQHLAKFDKRTKEAYVVGHTSRSNSYRVFIPSTNRVTISCDLYIAAHNDKTRISNQVSAKETTQASANTSTSCTIGMAADNWPSQGIKSRYGVIIDNNAESGTSVSTPEYTNLIPSNEEKGTLDQLATDGQNISLNELRRQRAMLDKYFEDLEVFGKDQPSAPEYNGQASTTQVEHMNTDERPPSPPQLTAYDDDSRYDEICNFIDIKSECPASYADAVAGSNNREWITAIKCELAAHNKNNTWTTVDQKPSMKLISTKWVFTIKKNADGIIERFKARLVARGFEQKDGVDYAETFAPVTRIDTVRALFAIAAAHKWHIEQFDVTSAFLNGVIDEEVYIKPPMGVKAKKNTCLRLNKALYGLKQAPRSWYKTLSTTLSELGFKQSDTDLCLFIRHNPSILLIGIYVDDGLMIGECPDDCRKMLDALKNKFEMRKIDSGIFLNIRFRLIEDGIIIDQQRYAADIVERFGMANGAPKSSPISDTTRLWKSTADDIGKLPFRQVLGALQYIANTTRPDLLFCSNLLGRFSHQATMDHWEAILDVLRYLKGTIDSGIKFNYGTSDIMAYSDADWANNRDDRSSTSGGVAMIGGGAVSYHSRKQSVPAQSSTEAEYLAANEVSNTLRWLDQLYIEVGLLNKRSILFMDNIPAINQIKTNVSLKSTKHIEIKYHNIRSSYKRKVFDLKYVSTQENAADILTKPLNGPKMKLLRRKLGLVDLTGICLTMLCTLTIIQEPCKAGRLFEKIEPILWFRTDHYINIGVEYLDVELIHANTCSIIRSLQYDAVDGTIYNFEGEAVKRLEEICFEEYERKIKTALKDLLQCTQTTDEAWYTKHQKRIKRAIWFLVIGAIALFTVVTTIFASTVVLEHRVSNLEANQANLERQVTSLRTKIETQSQLNNNTIRILEQNMLETKKTIKSLYAFASKSAEVAWTSAQTYIELEEHVRALRNLASHCRQGHVSTLDLHQITGIKRMLELDSELTAIETVEAVNATTTKIGFYYPMIDNSTQVFKVAAFDHWVNLTTVPIKLSYKGPTTVIFNQKLNCTKGIRDPTTRAVTETCNIVNYLDPELQHWSVVDGINLEKSSAQIFKTDKTSYIYCMLDKIMIGGEYYKCPPYPFSMPNLENFSGDNFINHVRMTSYKNFTKNITPIRSKHFSQITKEENYDDLLELFAEMQRKNRLIAEKEDFNINPLAYIRKWTFWAMLGVSTASFLITTYITWRVTKWCQTGRANTATDERANVNITTNLMTANLPPNAHALAMQNKPLPPVPPRPQIMPRN